MLEAEAEENPQGAPLASTKFEVSRAYPLACARGMACQLLTVPAVRARATSHHRAASHPGARWTRAQVVVPDEASPGDTLHVALPGGHEVKVVVPPGVPPGSVLTCSAHTSSAASPLHD